MRNEELVHVRDYLPGAQSTIKRNSGVPQQMILSHITSLILLSVFACAAVSAQTPGVGVTPFDVSDPVSGGRIPGFVCFIPRQAVVQRHLGPTVSTPRRMHRGPPERCR